MNLLRDFDGTVMSMRKVVADYPKFARRNNGDAFTDNEAITLLRQRELEWSYGLVPASSWPAASTAEERLLSIYDVLNDWFHRDDYQTCVIITLAIEMARQGTLSTESLDYIDHVREMIGAFAIELQLRDPVGFALSWRVLMKGAILAAVDGDIDAALRAKSMAYSLIRRHISSSEFDYELDYQTIVPSAARAVAAASAVSPEAKELASAIEWLEFG
ncbi:MULTISPECIES: hypothetical protein [Subtercola]|uniref:Uncharacterized protein n=1 Tax=Subtercola vilae TaxID=2056433 RepID=A0A4T2C927_9MICO|nr:MULTISPECIES: hypothetical protein [Subtercola]MEA9984887.1 hypothetical protein [Subtercola sp. RTI3]TIH40449.1 hypothetical protein D4765_02580 [Subtercola vilae]